MGRVTERREVFRVRDGNVYSTRSCGPCDKAGPDAVRTTVRGPVTDTPPVRFEPELLAGLPDRLRAAQRDFDRTGGPRGTSMNVYTGRNRIALRAAATQD